MIKPKSSRVHRILAPRLVVLIGTASEDGRKNIIPINNITSVSVSPSMVLIAVYKSWITAKNLESATHFTVSVPHREQLELVWKLGAKYSGYELKDDKISEFSENLDLNFSQHGPVLKDALGWIEYEITEKPDSSKTDHLLIIGTFTNAFINPNYYTDKITPIGNPKPFMQWETNHFVEASDIFTVDYFGEAS
jgi:flavin reductase (DIM6/NTAB) family NADH-FMN oxidoreductase RutF